MGVNDEFIAVWNEILVPKFRRFRHVFVAGAAAHSDVALARHAPRAGDRALDLGCGFGENSLDLARLVGDAGEVVGLDCCEAFLETGRADAARAGLRNARFVLGDAQDARFDQPFGYAFSRFGTMFFQSPKGALRNIRAALVPGGRFVSLVWRSLADNPWMGIPKKVVLEHLPPPPDDGKKCGPGPFSMADEETARAIHEGAGFAGVRFERIDADVLVGRTVDEAIDFQLELGPAGEIVREAGERGQAQRDVVVAALRRALEPYQTPAGIVMGSSSWCITATSPA